MRAWNGEFQWQTARKLIAVVLLVTLLALIVYAGLGYRDALRDTDKLK